MGSVKFLQGDDLKKAVSSLVNFREGSIPLFHENAIQSVFRLGPSDIPSADVWDISKWKAIFKNPVILYTAVTAYITSHFLQKGRFMSLRERLDLERSIGVFTEQFAGLNFVSYINAVSYPFVVFSQGMSTVSCRGAPLYKSVLDLGIYTALLSDQRPKTIIEIGSGSGGSAYWYAAMLRMQGIEEFLIVSFDINQVNVENHDGENDPNIVFLYGDCFDLEGTFFSQACVSPISWKHPWLVVEDAHANVEQVLRTFMDLMCVDDYLVVEDVECKKSEMLKLFVQEEAPFVLDTKYLDLYGYNLSSFPHSLLKRV